MFEVETNQASVPIEDLGLVVRRGEPLWITQDQLSRSTCLKHLQRIGKVRVTPGKPSRVEKAPPPKPVQPKRAQIIPPETPRERPQKSKTGTEDIAGIIKRTAQSAANEAVRALHPKPTFEGLEEKIERAVSRAVSKIPGPVTSPQLSGIPTPAVDGSSPVFIPDKIVSDTSVDLSLKTESSSDSSVGDAAAALKAKRKEKKQ